MLPSSLSVLIWSSSFSWLINVPAVIIIVSHEYKIKKCDMKQLLNLCYQVKLQTMRAQGPKHGIGGTSGRCPSLTQEPESPSPPLLWSPQVSFQIWAGMQIPNHLNVLSAPNEHCSRTDCFRSTVSPGLWGSCYGAAVLDSWLPGCQQWAGSWHSAPGWWWPVLPAHSAGYARGPPSDKKDKQNIKVGRESRKNAKNDVFVGWVFFGFFSIGLRVHTKAHCASNV